MFVGFSLQISASSVEMVLETGGKSNGARRDFLFLKLHHKFLRLGKDFRLKGELL